VAVEEARRDEFATAIQLVRAGIAADAGNLFATNRDISGVNLVAEDVDDAAAFEDEVRRVSQ
jgi:hypothetical protein